MVFIGKLLFLVGFAWVVIDLSDFGEFPLYFNVFSVIQLLMAGCVLGLPFFSKKLPESFIRDNNQVVLPALLISFFMSFGIKHMTIVGSISWIEFFAYCLIVVSPPIVYWLSLRKAFVSIFVLGFLLILFGSIFVLGQDVWKGLVFYLLGFYTIIWNFKRASRKKEIRF